MLYFLHVLFVGEGGFLVATNGNTLNLVDPKAVSLVRARRTVQLSGRQKKPFGLIRLLDMSSHRS